MQRVHVPSPLPPSNATWYKMRLVASRPVCLRASIPLVGGGNSPFPSLPPLLSPSPFLPPIPFPFPSFPLWSRLWGLEERLSSPSGSWPHAAAKCILMHFSAKLSHLVRLQLTLVLMILVATEPHSHKQKNVDITCIRILSVSVRALAPLLTPRFNRIQKQTSVLEGLSISPRRVSLVSDCERILCWCSMVANNIKQMPALRYVHVFAVTNGYTNWRDTLSVMSVVTVGWWRPKAPRTQRRTAAQWHRTVVHKIPVRPKEENFEIFSLRP